MSCIVQTPEKYRPARHENHDTENYKREQEEKTEESDSSATYNTPRFSDRHNYGGMTRNRYICKKEENQNGKTI